MLTLVSAMDRAARLYGARPAIIDRERTFTWAEFLDRVARAATVLGDHGLGPGDRFAILSRNTFRNAEMVHAGYWMGAVPVPVNIRLATPEIRFVLDDSDAKLLVVEDAMADLAMTDELATWRGRVIHQTADGDDPADAAWPQYEALLAAAAPAAPREAAEDDDAILFYTGGTTGRSKGVQLTHRNVIANGMQVAPAMRIKFDDVYLHVAPMFHSADLLGTGYTLMGATHAFLPQFSGAELLRALRDYRVTQVMLAPTMIIMALQEDDFETYDLSHFRLLFYGSSPMAVEWIRRAMDRFPGEIQQGYGLTETSPILTTLDMEEHAAALATGEFDILRSVGRPVIGVDLRIVSDDGNEVPVGEGGEVVIRAPNVTRGYLNRAEENAAAFRGGWFHTGDVGRVDEAGYLYLLDRKKDMVITGGENVYTSEVEAALYQHPGVHEAAVVGVPDTKYGEALFAAIVKTPGANPTEDDIIAHCRQRIGGYKVPRRVAFVDAMPKSAMGKILKNELRRIYSD
jgi:long-chain acyl-CoA synthetase